METAGGSGRGGMTLIHMSYASESKVGMMAWASGQARGCPHTNPVPLGPNIHLCVPAIRKSQPTSLRRKSSTPRA